jgi:tetratricopeptide (TPR) repeat protein
MRTKEKIIIVAATLSLVSLAGYLADAVQPVVSGETIKKSKESLPLTLLGQLRINLDDYLWLKTDDYLHFGVTEGSSTYTALTNRMMGDFKARMGESAGSEDKQDWRGIFAELELFHPEKGNHGDPRELLPWYRVQTSINPADTAAYVNGAFFLADFAKKPNEALAFLNEGLENNPESIEVLQAIGRLYYEKWKNYDQAILHLQNAVDIGKGTPNRNEAQQEAFELAYVFLTRSYREKGDIVSAIHSAEEGLAECPNSGLIKTIHRIVQRDTLS